MSAAHAQHAAEPVGGGPSEAVETELRSARVEAARIARAAVAGEITSAQAREMWPLPEDIDPSTDALAHIYFDHFVWTAKRCEPDEDDVASVIDLADLMAEGDPLDEEYQRQFDGSGWSLEFDLGQVVIVLAAIAFVVYLAVRFF